MMQLRSETGHTIDRSRFALATSDQQTKFFGNISHDTFVQPPYHHHEHLAQTSSEQYGNVSEPLSPISTPSADIIDDHFGRVSRIGASFRQSWIADERWPSTFLPNVVNTADPCTFSTGIGATSDPATINGLNELLVSSPVYPENPSLYGNLSHGWQSSPMTASIYDGAQQNSFGSQNGQYDDAFSLNFGSSIWDTRFSPEALPMFPASISVYDALGSGNFPSMTSYENTNQVLTNPTMLPIFNQDILPAVTGTSMNPSLIRGRGLAPRSSAQIKRSTAKSRKQSSPFTIIPVNPINGALHGRITKPRRAFASARRKEVAQVRKKGACFRCRMWNTSCGPHDPCDRCVKQTNRTGCDGKQICFRPNVDDCGFFREASLLHTKPARRAMKWVTTTQVNLQFFVTPPNWGSRPLNIPCRHFMVDSSDNVIKHIGGKNANKPLVIPAYAAIDLENLKRAIRDNMRHYTEQFYENSIRPKSLQIVQKTLEMALKFAQRYPKSLVSAALDIWTGSKLCANERCLTGTEVLGLSAVDDELSHLHGYIPIPPVLDHQCDSMAIEWMKELSTYLLKALVLKMQQKKDLSHWFEIFLTMFVLLNNLEYVYGIQREFSDYLGPTTTFGSHVQETSRRYMSKWKRSSDNLLVMYDSYFKHVKPFDVDCRTKALVDGKLDHEAEAYFVAAVDCLPEITANRKEISEVTGYNFEMVWCRSLFV